MTRSEEWLKHCDPNCKQKNAFPNCTLCDIALEYKYNKQTGTEEESRDERKTDL